MIAWNEYFGFSLLCYIQRECNYKFTENGVHHKFILNPTGFEIAGPKVRGLADFSMMPNIYPWEKREEWREVAETQSLIEYANLEFKEFRSAIKLRGPHGGGSLVGRKRRSFEWYSWSKSWTELKGDCIYVGPDIFLRDGVLVDYFGDRRKFMGVENFSAPMIFRNGVLRNEDIHHIGDYALQIDEDLGLQGKFVDALWNVSQFNFGRGELYMVSDRSSGNRVLAMSCVEDRDPQELKLSDIKRRPGAVIVRDKWCVELYRLFIENISLG